MATDLKDILSKEVRLLIEPLRLASSSRLLCQELFSSIGWDIEHIAGLSIDDIRQILGDIAAHAKQLEGGKDLSEVLDHIKAILNDLRTVHVQLSRPGIQAPPEFSAIGANLFTLLALTYLQLWHPSLYRLGVLLAVIRAPEDFPPQPVIKDSTGNVVRFPSVSLDGLGKPVFMLRKVPRLLRDPIGLFKEEYGGVEVLASTAAAKRMSDKFFPRLTDFLWTLDIKAVYGLRTEVPQEFGVLGNLVLSRMLTISIDGRPTETLDSSSASLSLYLSSADEGNQGLVVVPSGSAELLVLAGSWQIMFVFSGGVEALAVGPQGFALISGAGKQQFHASITARKLTDDIEAAFNIGDRSRSHLEIGHTTIKLDAQLTSTGQSYGVLMAFDQGVLVITPGDGDGFLQGMLPGDGLRINFDLGIGWSRDRGFYLRGSGSLEATFPVHVDLGILIVSSIYLALRAGDSDVQTEVAATFTVKLGPVAATVERLGVKGHLQFPDSGGNLGLADLSLQFKPPAGAGIAVNTAVIAGGGYLFFDPDEQQYAGVLQLEFVGTIALKAIGLLTTRLPDGSKGFSLLIIITAEGFAPIQLGLGFTINGVGGLLGVNRTVDVDVLRHGIKTGALESTLFPRNPVANAPALISMVNAVFPAARDRYLIGPMAIIGWGTPPILIIKAALILEIPDPVRLIILARLTAVLPEEKAALVRLNVDAIGVIDFNKGELSIDATIFDSRLLQLVLSGDMALRVNWSGNPQFLLAVGGFHPRFPLPAGFPRLNRITIALSEGNNPRLRLEAYLALTSNTLQFGARLEFYAGFAGFSLDGYFGFDALIQFEPFHFITDLSAGLALRHDGKVLMSITLAATLSGPTPWYLHGKVSFHLLCLKIEHEVTYRSGPPEPPALPPPIEVLPLLMKELRNRQNWTIELPQDEHPLVTFRDVPGAGKVLLVHPFGIVAVREKVVPLGVTIGKFGNSKPVDYTSFNLAVLPSAPATAQLMPQPLSDKFARSQFFEMRDDEKLSKPSFEDFTSGYRFGLHQTTFPSNADDQLHSDVEYEQEIIDFGFTISKEVKQAVYRPPDLAFRDLTTVTAAREAPIRKRSRYEIPEFALAGERG